MTSTRPKAADATRYLLPGFVESVKRNSLSVGREVPEEYLAATNMYVGFCSMIEISIEYCVPPWR